jgi:N-acetylglucosaminyldiphosphoundecaprenol N-acetyl-beta-D-mannosaminyltransferase
MEKKMIVNTINPHSYCVAKHDKYYNDALHFSDILLPDGIGIVWAIQILTGNRIVRLAGSDLHNRLLQKMNEDCGTVFYMGSSSGTLKKIQKKVMREYPNIVVATYSPPFKPVFTDADNAMILAAINEFKPDVLFVGMTAPKQEKWVHKNKNQINAKVICSIGAVFDFYSGVVKRPGEFWIHIYMEWFLRMIRNPKRLWRRSFISAPQFLWDVFLTKIAAINNFKKHPFFHNVAVVTIEFCITSVILIFICSLLLSCL